ncbi:A/G-specific DNA-adenine glycosylase [Bernardetia litoralis DSM 6794]|uniref:Adenine DNA glycosylase n=1 Tax=Bernardetia litoralis (strain ATCC 23117 / DSM 6794 / NBRC 15988 / NCIMB 1366 / Fx l1 / Sio-4) TaxID=880071 RepID=I4AKI6_BERLS|nr:A/G-specific adenine glycosylase [Bernardetia litoralis]AFM04471.1 A/G-specific DNA-adenine glycosylase [Bernardetia litoralis DSM 6794]
MTKNSFFAQKIISWYHQNKRDLPWRDTQNPYKIWLSEIILQQTRVAQGMPYYEKFIEHFPTVQELAMADEQTVLMLWQGLGYYSRARNLHAAAKYISDDLNGTFPNNYTEIKKLKGVGDYTAAAISSFAFDEVQAVVDGNVYRVLARFFGVEKDITSTEGKKEFRELAQKLINKKEPAIYNQSIMEFGALQCVPKNPNCKVCPLQQKCTAFEKNLIEKLPIKEKKTVVKDRFMHYFVFVTENKTNTEKKVLIRQRQEGDIWQGLNDFFVIEFLNKDKKNFEPIKELQIQLEKDGFNLELKITTKFKSIHESIIFKHQLSHRTLYAKFYTLEIKNTKEQNEFWNKLKKKYNLEEINWQKLDKIPKPVLITKYLDYLSSHLF